MTKASYYLSAARSDALIRGYFTRHSSDPEEISDLTQEAIAAVLDAYHRYRSACTFTTWVYSICRNVYRKHVYYQVRRKKIDVSLVREYASDSAPSAANRSFGTGYNEDGKLEIGAALEALEPADRRLYKLYYLEQRSVADVAAALEKTDGTTKWLLHRLRRRIRDVILRADS